MHENEISEKIIGAVPIYQQFYRTRITRMKQIYTDFLFRSFLFQITFPKAITILTPQRWIKRTIICDNPSNLCYLPAP